MESSMEKPDNLASIADLQIEWDQLNDFDRARAVHQFHSPESACASWRTL
jgi:hypothetical protein